jgi:hypothetical protein
MFCDDDEGDIRDMRNAISPICSECGNPLEEDAEYEHGCCIVCLDYLTRRK